MTLRDLHNDPAKLAAFMGWEFAPQERVETVYSSWPHRHYKTVTVSAVEVIAEKWRAYWLSIQPKRPEQTHANFVRECAREALGIKGRTAAEVIEKCLSQRPDIYTAPRPCEACKGQGRTFERYYYRECQTCVGKGKVA